MQIHIQTRESLVNASYKLPQKLKSRLECFAKKERVAQGEIVRAFLEYALEAYEKGNVRRLWSETMMEHFRKQILPGDKVLANRMVGYVTQINTEDNLRYFEIEIAKGVLVWMLDECITDVLPNKDGKIRPEIIEEMNRFAANK